jgi:prostaglandin-endoperoxide synthase 2
MEVGLLNTPQFLREVEERTIEAGRAARLASYNDYRQACGYPRLAAFADVSERPDVQAALASCYSSVDDMELYVGLFAEDVVDRGVLGDLMGTMVGVDAFSQALTNPLLAPQIFSADTFTEAGMAEIANTSALSDIVNRVIPSGLKPRASFQR